MFLFGKKNKKGKREVMDLIIEKEGKPLLDGLFWFFLQSEKVEWTEVVQKFFDLEMPIEVIGYDWQGNCYGIKKGDIKDVLMFEVGTREILSLSCSLLEFVEDIYSGKQRTYLAKEFFDEWNEKENQKHKKIEYGKCIGYKIPLFLGGEDKISNLEYSDLDVYWSVLTQFIER